MLKTVTFKTMNLGISILGPSCSVCDQEMLVMCELVPVLEPNQYFFNSVYSNGLCFR